MLEPTGAAAPGIDASGASSVDPTVQEPRSTPQRPRMRMVEAFPVQHQGKTLVCLRDPLGVAPDPLVVGVGAYYLTTLFNGATSLDEIRAAFEQRFQTTLAPEQLEELVAALDAAYLLDTPAFAERARRVRDEFLASASRSAAHAGLCYAAEPEALRAEIAAYFEAAGCAGPSRKAAERSRTPQGLISPHIDPRRGAAAYAHAYAELMRREKPELIIILATSHYGGGPELFAATFKDYETPLGTVPTDAEFVKRLAGRYRRGDLFVDELLHRQEHSIEFQTLFLAATLGVDGYQVVPILVGSFYDLVRRAAMPASDGRVSSFLDALGELLAAEKRRTLIISGVDFAHIGRKFGDSFGVDGDGVLEDLKRHDLALIETIERGDPVDFFTAVAAEQDRRRICGLAPMYVQLELLRGRAGRLLKYGVAVEPETDSAVSYASLVFD